MYSATQPPRERPDRAALDDFLGRTPVIAAAPSPHFWEPAMISARAAPEGTTRRDRGSGFADDIRRIRSRTSFGTAGRPGFPERLSCAQCSRNFLRRQAITVSGRTITSASRQPGQTPESHDQKIRSLEWTGGRRQVRRSTKQSGQPSHDASILMLSDS